MLSVYGNVAKYTFRHNLLPHIVVAIGLCFLVPAAFGTTALDAQSAALPLETGLSILGIILFAPLFTPEQDSGVEGVILSRRLPYAALCIVRAVLSLLVATLCVVGFVIFLRTQDCAVGLTHIGGTMANVVFLGGMALLTAALSRNVVIGYMVPMLYFVIDMMSGAFGPLTLFSMMRTGSAQGKATLLACGVAMMALAVWLRQRRGR